MNDSPPDSVAVSRTRPVHWSSTRRPSPAAGAARRRARRSARARTARRPSRQPPLARVRHRLEPGREHVGGQPHPQRVVGADAARGVGELADPGVALLQRQLGGDVPPQLAAVDAAGDGAVGQGQLTGGAASSWAACPGRAGERPRWSRSRAWPAQAASGGASPPARASASSSAGGHGLASVTVVTVTAWARACRSSSVEQRRDGRRSASSKPAASAAAVVEVACIVRGGAAGSVVLERGAQVGSGGHGGGRGGATACQVAVGSEQS